MVRALATPAPLHACVLAAVLAALGCSSGREARNAPQGASARSVADVDTEPVEQTADLGPPVSEAEARVILGEYFRNAGYRVRYDVHVAREGQFELTVDGYDPEARVGFEYIAPAERNTDVTADERTRLARDTTHRILILDAMARPVLEQRAGAFLAGARQ